MSKSTKMAEDSGFEPDSWDSKSQVQTYIPILNKLVGPPGLEPGTPKFGLKLKI